jgi:Putative prokaryotic signal transducing protein
MYCPQCQGEYRDGFTVCDDCGVDLVAVLAPEDHEAPDYVTAFETSESDVIPVIKSVLEGAEIPYLVEGEDLMNLFPSDMLGGIFKPSAEVRFLVTADRAEEARALLAAHLEASADDASAGSDD